MVLLKLYASLRQIYFDHSPNLIDFSKMLNSKNDETPAGLVCATTKRDTGEVGV